MASMDANSGLGKWKCGLNSVRRPFETADPVQGGNFPESLAAKFKKGAGRQAKIRRDEPEEPSSR